MTSPEQRRDDEPLASALARVRIATLIQRDLAEYAQRPGLPPEEARAVEAASGRLLNHLRRTDKWVDRYAAANQVPDRKYLLDAEPKPYPQSGDLVQKMVWFAAESLRLAENIDRRLGLDRTARAEQALRASAARAVEPARLTRAGAEILGQDRDLQRLLQQGRLPATAMLLDRESERERQGRLREREARLQERQGKLHKRSVAEVAAARSTSSKRRRVEASPDKSSDTTSIAVAAALAMPGEGRHLEHGRTVTEDRTLGLLNEATVALGMIEASLRYNPWAEIARQTSSEQRGRTPAETPSGPARSAGPSRAASRVRR
jgi:hypothetical protein